MRMFEVICVQNSKFQLNAVALNIRYELGLVLLNHWLNVQFNCLLTSGLFPTTTKTKLDVHRQVWKITWIDIDESTISYRIHDEIWTDFSPKLLHEIKFKNNGFYWKTKKKQFLHKTSSRLMKITIRFFVDEMQLNPELCTLTQHH